MANAFPKRVLLTADTVGGVWTFAMGLSSGLRDRGIRVKLATFGPNAPGHSPDGVEWSHFPSKLEWMDDPWEDIRRGEGWLRSIVDEFEPDLVHLNTLSYGDAGFDVPVVQTIHSCVWSWWEAVRQSMLPPEWNRYQRHVQRSLQGANLLIAPTSALLDTISSHYAIETSDALTIYNGVDPLGFWSATPEPFVLSAGRLWDEAKNLKSLAAIAYKLPWPIYLAGNGSDRAFAGCHLLGELGQPALRDWYARASIYAAPAKYEPFGLGILEAACSGCALVLGDIPSLHEIWQDAALYVSNSADVLDAINTLISDASLREAMAQRALTRAQSFTANRMTECYLNAYSRMFACIS